MKSEHTKMIIVSAPSGAGKSTVVRHLLSVFPQLAFSVSSTSRPLRPGEAEGREYYFVTAARFRRLIAEGKLLEWQEVYPGSFYGTMNSEVDRMQAEGKVPVFDVDVVGGLNIKKMFGSSALAIFVKPPSPAILEQRLRARATDSEESLRRRLEKVKYEMTFEKDFDCVIVNDVLENALQEAEEAVKRFLALETTGHGR